MQTQAPDTSTCKHDGIQQMAAEATGKYSPEKAQNHGTASGDKAHAKLQRQDAVPGSVAQFMECSRDAPGIAQRAGVAPRP